MIFLPGVAVLRAEAGVSGGSGVVASDPTVSRTMTSLAVDAPAVLAVIDNARAQARARVWELTNVHAFDHDATAGGPLVIGLDATRVTSPSKRALVTFKGGSGFTRCAPSLTTARPGPVDG